MMTDEMEMLKKVGRNIAGIRNKKGLSQSELSTHAEIEKATLGHIETGTRNPTIKTLYKIAKALGVSLTELVRYK
jgi:transcriptional regulator with XRE-family HTH domain